MKHSKLKILPYVNALRPHQWVKNILLFFPAVVSVQIFSTNIFKTLCISFIAFCLVASSGYLFNDILDLESDRKHPDKKTRPLAAGQISILYSKVLILVLLVIAVSIALLYVNIKFFIILSIYFLSTAFYSLYIKRKIIADILTLAILYTFRVIAGGFAVDLALSVWILAFSMFVFLSLAAVKRLAELVENASIGLKYSLGRSYEVNDITIIEGISLVSGYISVLVIILHIFTEATQGFYSRPELLLGICPIIMYWITRMILLAHRGQMHHDPILFSLRDSPSRLSAVLIIIIAIVAKLS
jgi:4-hydroxybenzoate polyprenyltransferase|tara:strand:+ start:1871 stop:2770 length:900 start_codon:yes stop_codon:yes gene_type:complete